jgi:hypothetical protein
MRNIEPQQQYLLKNGKVLPFGVYDKCIIKPQTSYWDNEGLFSNKRFTERKTWIFFGIYSPDLYAGIAVVDAGFVATAFSYFFVPSKNLFIEDKTTMPLGFSKNFDPCINDKWKLGTYEIDTHNGIMNFKYRGKFNLEISAKLNDNGVSVVAPSQQRPFNFTYKDLCMESDVKISYKGEEFCLKGNYGAIDFTKGYPPKSTKWNWSSAIGTTASGKAIAFNLVKHFNDELENILWIDKERILLEHTNYILPQKLNKEEWKISTNDNILDTTFIPLGARSENLNAVVMKSIFTQPFGKFIGTILLEGKKEEFTAYGVCEDHFAVW